MASLRARTPKRLHVLAARTVPQGVAAMVAFGSEGRAGGEPAPDGRGHRRRLSWEIREEAGGSVEGSAGGGGGGAGRPLPRALEPGRGRGPAQRLTLFYAACRGGSPRDRRRAAQRPPRSRWKSCRGLVGRGLIVSVEWRRGCPSGFTHSRPPKSGDAWHSKWCRLSCASVRRNIATAGMPEHGEFLPDAAGPAGRQRPPPSPAAFAEAYDRLSEQTDEPPVIALSSGLSGTYQAALQGGSLRGPARGGAGLRHCGNHGRLRRHAGGRGGPGRGVAGGGHGRPAPPPRGRTRRAPSRALEYLRRGRIVLRAAFSGHCRR